MRGNSLIDKLKNAGFKVTKSRTTILSCIDEKKHFKLDDIISLHNEIYHKKPNIQSVYNVINTLLKLDLLKIRNEGQDTYYEHANDHIHFYCEGDKKRKHLENESIIIEDIKVMLKEKYNIAVKNLDIDIKIYECIENSNIFKKKKKKD